MVNITVIRDKEGFIWQIMMMGHAEAAEKGKDIVCAAISVTMYNALGALDELVKLRGFYTESDGDMKVSIPEGLSANNMNTVRIILETTVIGLRQIRKRYKKRIKIIEEIL